jgi:hypothetical protein
VWPACHPLHSQDARVLWEQYGVILTKTLDTQVCVCVQASVCYCTSISVYVYA